MAFPTPPINPNTSTTLAIPQWCINSSGNKVDPELLQDVINYGWTNVSGQNYGQIPPYQWVNWTGFQVGQWLNFLCGTPTSSSKGAIFYLAAGNFDNGVNILGHNTLRFFNTTDTTGFSVGFFAPAGLSQNFTYQLPSNLPNNDGISLVSDTLGNLSFNTNVSVLNLTFLGAQSGGTIFRAVTSGVATSIYTWPITVPPATAQLTSDNSGTLSWVNSTYLYSNSGTNINATANSWTTLAHVFVVVPGVYAISGVVQCSAVLNSGLQMTLTVTQGTPGTIIAKDIITIASSNGAGALTNVKFTLTANTNVYLQVNPATLSNTCSGYITAMGIIGGT